MEFFRIKKDIPFMKHALIFNAISFITFALAVFFLLTRGLHLSVEFTGGTVMEVAYSQPAELAKVRETVSGLGYTDVQVQSFGTPRDVLIRLPVQKGVTSAQQSEQVLQALKANDADVTLRRTEFVGPQVGEELVHGGLMALAFVVLGIVIYLAFRFEWKFGVAAIIANLHDIVIILGLDQGEFPSPNWSDNTPERMEEARRLFYVGLTRARDQVHLMYSGFRQDRYNRIWREGPSQFLDGLLS